MMSSFASASSKPSGRSSHASSSSGMEGDGKDSRIVSASYAESDRGITDKPVYSHPVSKKAWGADGEGMEAVEEANEEDFNTAPRVKQYAPDTDDALVYIPQMAPVQESKETSTMHTSSDTPTAPTSEPFIPAMFLNELVEDMHSYVVDGVRYKSLVESVKEMSGKYLSSARSGRTGRSRASVTPSGLADDNSVNINGNSVGIHEGGFFAARSARLSAKISATSTRKDVDKKVDMGELEDV